MVDLHTGQEFGNISFKGPINITSKPRLPDGVNEIDRTSASKSRFKHMHLKTTEY